MKLDHLAQILAAQAQKRPIALATRLADGAQSLYDGVTCTGAVALSAEEIAQAHGLLVAGRSASLAASQGAIFLRSYAPPAKLVVIGAVHIAQFLAPMAALAGFEVIVIDPRGSFATEARFPGVTLVAEWPGPALARIGLDDHTAVVTLTHDPKLTIRHSAPRCKARCSTSARWAAPAPTPSASSACASTASRNSRRASTRRWALTWAAAPRPRSR